MIEVRHTLGPWSYRSQPHDDWGVVRAGRFWICQAKDPRAIDDDVLAAHRTTKTDPWEANARLISAAPEMLHALQRVAQIIESAGEVDAYPDVFAAIAKATAIRSTDAGGEGK